MKSAKELLRKAKMSHLECEDSWYSCPLSANGCSNDSVPKRCDCGANKTNQALKLLNNQVDSVVTLLEELLTDEYIASIYIDEIHSCICQLTGDADLN